MKSIPKLVQHLAIGVAVLVGSPLTAQTEVPLVEVTISGGSGTPLTVELLKTVTFNNVPRVSGSYGFALIGAAGGNTATASSRHTGTMAWNDSGNNSGSSNLRVDNFGGLTRSDIFAYWNSRTSPRIQSTMTLSAGTRMTTDNIDSAVLTGTGSYVIRMIRSGGHFIGDPGVVTPKTVALDKIAAYAEDDSNPIPTVQDYADAGVSGVAEGSLAAVNAAVADVAGTAADTTAEIQALVDPILALAKIAAYADDDSNPAPTVQDYMDAGVSGVMEGSLAAVNAAVADMAGMAADTTAEIQALVDPIITKDNALTKIAAYADDDSNPVPTVQDYTDAAVSGVTEGNLRAVNAAVDAVSGPDADTTAEIQALVDAVVAALAKIAAYADSDSNPVPTVQDYADAGVRGVREDNLAVVNAAVAAVAGMAADTTAEIQALVPVEVRILGGGGTPLTIQLLRDITFTNVPKGLGRYGFLLVDAAKGNTTVSTPKHVGTMAWNGTGNDSSFGSMGLLDGVDRTLEDISVFWGTGGNQPKTSSTMTLSAGTRVTTGNLNTTVLSGAGSYVIRMYRTGGTFIGDPGVQDPHQADVRISGGSGAPLTVELLRTMTFNNVPEGVDGYGFALIGAAKGNTVTASSGHTGAMAWNDSENISGGSPVEMRAVGALTLEDISVYWESGNVSATQSTMTLSAGTRVTTDNIDATIFSGEGSYEIRMIRNDGTFLGDPGVITPKTAAFEQIVAYADDNSNPVPTVQDYTDAAVSDVTGGNLVAVNAAVDAVSGPDADTTAEIQALVAVAAAALAKIAAYADSDSNPVPTVQDYADAGVRGVREDNLAVVNAAVAAVAGMAADTTAEIQALVPVEVRILGGGGTPVTIQLLRDVTFTNVPEGLGRYGFVLVGAAKENRTASVSFHRGTMAWNGTAANSNFGALGVFSGDNSTGEDIAAFWSAGGNLPRTRSTMTLSAGTRVTTSNIAATVLSGAGSYVIRMINEHSHIVGDPGVQDPHQADVRISGGSEAPLTVELLRTMTFNNVPEGVDGYGFALIGAAKGNTVTASSRHTGTMAWNDSENISGDSLVEMRAVGALTLEDISAYWESANVSATQSTMTLSAGTRVTTDNIDATVVSGEGSYEIRMIRNDGTFLGDPGVITPKTVALEKIVAYADSDSNPAPTVQDYMDADVTGVTATNLMAVNAAVADVSGPDADTTAEIQTLVDVVVDAAVAVVVAALAKIAAYADSDSNPVPTVQDYMDAGVRGVTGDNLAAVNAAVAAVSETEADETSEIQALAASPIALVKISAYADSDSNPAPTVQDYTDAGVTGVTRGNRRAVNSAVADVSRPDADTTAEIQALADAAVAVIVAAIAKIAAYADSDSNPEPTVQDYMDAGLRDVTGDNLAAVNSAVAAVSGPDADTTTEIQALVDAAVTVLYDALCKIEDYAYSDSNPVPTVQDYMDAGVTGVTGDNLAAVNVAVAAVSDSDVDTTAKIQALIDSLTATLTPTQITAVDFDSATQTVTLRWLDTGDSYSIQASDNLDWGAAPPIPLDQLNGTETDLGDEIEFSFTNSSATGATRFWRVVTTD